MNKIVSSQSMKRHGSAIASGSGAKKRSRKPVEISEDVWFEALKHLSCTKWSKMRLVTRQLNGMIQRNVSRLPLAIIEYAAMSLKERNRIEPKIIVADSVISPNAQWFKNGGMALDVPADIQLNKTIIPLDLKDNFCVDLCVLGPAQERPLNKYEKGRPWFSGNEWLSRRQFKSEVLFYAEFGPHRNQTSLASMAFFLKLLYDPSTYVKELPMYAFDKKLKGILFAGEEERYIRCGTFTLMGEFSSTGEACESIIWMEKNVQADMIKFPKNVYCCNREFCDAICNYIFGSSWISANQVVNLQKVTGLNPFLKALIKKFRTIPAVQSTFPIVVFIAYRVQGDTSLIKLFSEESKVKEKVEDVNDDDDRENSEGDDEPENSEDDSDESEDSDDNSDESEDSEDDSDESEDSESGETYTISSGSNRMRVELVEKNGKRIKHPRLIPWLPGTEYYTYPYDVRITVMARN